MNIQLILRHVLKRFNVLDPLVNLYPCIYLGSLEEKLWDIAGGYSRWFGGTANLSPFERICKKSEDDIGMLCAVSIRL
jgi:hypothetical protein